MQEASCFNMSAFNLKEILTFFAFFAALREIKSLNPSNLPLAKTQRTPRKTLLSNKMGIIVPEAG